MVRVLLVAAIVLLVGCSDESRPAQPAVMPAKTPPAVEPVPEPEPEVVDPAEAELRRLEDATRALPVTESESFLVLRLAALRLAAGDSDGYAREIRRLPRNSAARRLVDRLGPPEEDRAARDHPDLPFTVSRLVIAERGLAISDAVVTRYVRGLDAYLAEGEPPLLPAAEIASGNLPRAKAAMAALAKGPGPEAKRLLLAGDQELSPGPAWQLLFAEALFANGEVGRAEQVIRDLEKVTGELGARPLVRRIRALLLMSVDDDTKTIAALEALVQDHPDERAAWEDLAGLHLASGRYARAQKALIRLAQELPGMLAEERYVTARRQAAEGIIRTSNRARDLMLLDGADDPEVRRFAARAAAVLPTSEREVALRHFAVDPDRGARVLAVRGLSGLRTKQAIGAVRDRLEDSDPLVRAAAAHALGTMCGTAGAPDLVNLLDDASGYVREVAVNELRRLSGRRFGFDPRAAEEARRAPAGKWREWAKTETTSRRR